MGREDEVVMFRIVLIALRRGKLMMMKNIKDSKAILKF